MEKGNNVDFFCSWHIQFISLEEGHQHDLDLLSYWKPHLEDMELICSNQYLDMPLDDGKVWEKIQEIDTSNFTPSLVRRIRSWLFGHFYSYLFFNDFDMMKYLFASCGAVQQFCTLNGMVGHHWKASAGQAADMIDYGALKGADVLYAQTVGMNWLEYQC